MPSDLHTQLSFRVALLSVVFSHAFSQTFPILNPPAFHPRSPQ